MIVACVRIMADGKINRECRTFDTSTAGHDCLSEAIARIDQQVHGLIIRMDEQVEAGQATLRALIILLCSIPGIGTLAATVILSEIGRDMSRFPTSGHLLAWAGLCPGQNESAA